MKYNQVIILLSAIALAGMLGECTLVQKITDVLNIGKGAGPALRSTDQAVVKATETGLNEDEKRVLEAFKKKDTALKAKRVKGIDDLYPRAS